MTEHPKLFVVLMLAWLVVIYGLGYVAGMRKERRRWRMEIPARGEIHFLDGPVRHIHASEPDAALESLLAVSKPSWNNINARFPE